MGIKTQANASEKREAKALRFVRIDNGSIAAIVNALGYKKPLPFAAPKLWPGKPHPANLAPVL